MKSHEISSYDKTNYYEKVMLYELIKYEQSRHLMNVSGKERKRQKRGRGKAERSNRSTCHLAAVEGVPGKSSSFPFPLDVKTAYKKDSSFLKFGLK